MHKRPSGLIAFPNFSGQLDPATFRVGPDRHIAAFGLFQHRTQSKLPLQHATAVAMNIPHGCADLSIGIGVDGFFEKIDQAAFTLQSRQQRHRVAATRFWRSHWLRSYGSFLRGSSLRRFLFGQRGWRFQKTRHSGGKRAAGENAPYE